MRLNFARAVNNFFIGKEPMNKHLRCGEPLGSSMRRDWMRYNLIKKEKDRFTIHNVRPKYVVQLVRGEEGLIYMYMLSKTIRRVVLRDCTYIAGKGVLLRDYNSLIPIMMLNIHDDVLYIDKTHQLIGDNKYFPTLCTSIIRTGVRVSHDIQDFSSLVNTEIHGLTAERKIYALENFDKYILLTNKIITTCGDS